MLNNINHIPRNAFLRPPAWDPKGCARARACCLYVGASDFKNKRIQFTTFRGFSEEILKSGPPALDSLTPQCYDTRRTR